MIAIGGFACLIGLVLIGIKIKRRRQDPVH
jgi:hypothetical protein